LFESMYFIRRLCTNAKKSGVQILTKKEDRFLIYERDLLKENNLYKRGVIYSPYKCD